MKRSIARKWAKALESGEIKQAKGQLRKGDAMCCLGVLCNMHAEAHPEFATKQKTKEYYDGALALPPEIVREWAGLSYDNAYLDDHDAGLSELNDKGMTFPEIAKIIRKHWKEL